MRAGIDGLTLEDAVGPGAQTANVMVSLPPETLARVGAFIALLDAADEFCRDERLLSLARSAEQQRFQRWILGEFVRQGAGARRWPGTTCPPMTTRPR